MIAARDIQPVCAEERELQDFDLHELEAEDQRSHFALKYVARLEAVLQAARECTPTGGVILEVGCAQANASLLLAEEGFRTIGLDLMPAALAYARKRHERGAFWGLCGSAAELPLKAEACSTLIMGELLEHCSQPAEILRGATRCVKAGGTVILTTVNGANLRSQELTYHQALAEGFTRPEFGPGGEDHLFALTPGEMRELVQAAGLRVRRLGLVGSSLHTDRVMGLKRLLGPGAIRGLSRMLCALPAIGRMTGLTLIVVAGKEG